MSLKHHAATGIKWTSLSSVLTTSLQLVQLAVLARLLMPGDFGLMAMVMVVIGFAEAYTDMGLSNAIIYRQDASKDQLSSLYWLNIAVGFIVFGIVVACSQLIVSLYHEPRLTQLLRLTALGFLITPCGQQFQTLLQKELRFDRLALIEIISKMTGVIVAVMSAFAGHGVYALIWGQLVGVTSKTFMLLAVGFRRWRPRIYFNRSELKGYVGFGLYQMGEKSINYVGWNMDKLLIGSLLGAQALGYYNVAYQLMAKPFQVFNPIITRVAFPVFVRIRTDNKRMQSGFLDAIRIISVVLFPIYAGMVVLAKPFILLFLGSDWMPALSVFQILAVLGFFFSLGNPLGSLLLAKGRADMGFYLNIVMIMLYGFAIWMGSGFGIEGIAWGLVIATSLVLFPMGFWVRWFLVRMGPVQYISAFSPSLLAALFMGGMIHYLGSSIQFLNDHFIKLLVLAGVGACIYIPLVYLSQRETFVRLWKIAR